MKDKINFDPSSAEALAASDNIGSWVRAGTDGDRISSTLVSGKEGLDVNVISAIAVDLDGFYVLATNPTPDTVGQILNSRAASPDETGQVERVTAAAASSDAVVAADVHGQDVNAFGMVFNGTTWDRLRGSTAGVTIQDGGNSITVDGTVAVTQSTSPWVVSDAALANTAMTNGAKSVTTTATAIVSPLASRKYFMFQNVDNREVYIGKDATVTSANGWKISPGSDFMARCGAALSMFAIGVSATSDTRYLEFS